jgi:hypothetical protein
MKTTRLFNNKFYLLHGKHPSPIINEQSASNSNNNNTQTTTTQQTSTDLTQNLPSTSSDTQIPYFTESTLKDFNNLETLRDLCKKYNIRRGKISQLLIKVNRES